MEITFNKCELLLIYFTEDWPPEILKLMYGLLITHKLTEMKMRGMCSVRSLPVCIAPPPLSQVTGWGWFHAVPSQLNPLLLGRRGECN